jgi:acyl-CoA thioester hydrolase
MDSSVSARVRVRYSETDQMAVVYHGNYIVWMEVGRVEYCRAKGIVYREMESVDGILLVVAEVGCRYAAPALYDDEVEIRTRVADSSSRMIRFEYEIVRPSDGSKLATGFTKHVFCGRDKRPLRLPEKYWATFGIRPVAP